MRRRDALEPIRQAVRERYGRIGEKVARGLLLRHDHGSQYMADDFQQEIDFLGITSSPSFVRAPEGNGCAERMIRTLKEQLLWVRTFETVEELRQALLAWQKAYNERWMVGRHGHRSPARVRRHHHAAMQRMAARITPSGVSRKSGAVQVVAGRGLLRQHHCVGAVDQRGQRKD